MASNVKGMNYKEALTKILDFETQDEAYRIIDDNKSESKEEIHELLKRFIEDIKSEKNLKFSYIVSLLNLVLKFHVTDFQIYLSALQEYKVINIDGDNEICLYDLLGKAIAISISSVEDIEKLDLVFFPNKKTNSGYQKDIIWTRYAAFVAIRMFCMTNVGFDKDGNIVECSVKMKQRQDILISFYKRILDCFDNNSGTDALDNEHVFIRAIIQDCIQNDFFDSVSLLKKLTGTVIKILTLCGLGSTNGYFKEYKRYLNSIAPRTYSRAVDIADYIRKLSRNLEDEDIFFQSSRNEVGKYLFYKAVKELQRRHEVLYNVKSDESKDKDIVKIAIQFNKEYPYNNRPIPIVDDEYYLELCDYLEINQIPWERYKLAKDLYEKVRKGYQELVKKINRTEDACEKFIAQLDKEAQNIKEINNKKIDFDNRELKEKLLNVLQKQKEITSLLRFAKTENEKKELDCYLEYCKNNISKTFELFTLNRVSEDEKEHTIREWVLMDVRRSESSKTDNYNAIEERFKPYFRILKSMDEIIDENPEKMLGILRYRIKAIPFMNEIREKYSKKVGLKILEEESPDFKAYIKEINEHPLFFKELLKTDETIDYIPKYRKVAPEAIRMIKDNINQSLCLKKRKAIIEKILNQFENKEYDLVINLIPIQIEGLFADFLVNSQIYSSMFNMEIIEQIYSHVLVEKANDVENSALNLGFDTIGYFKYYFNTVYRNTVAHGNYHLLFVQYKDQKINPPEDLVMELVAHELLFDLNYFVDVIAKSNEIDAASMYLYQTKSQLSAKNTKVDLKEDAEKHLNYDRLLLDLIGESRYNYSNYLHGFFVSYETVQILYWIFNPYYEDEVGIEIVKPIREALLSTDFWKYALQHFESWLWVKDGESFKKAVVKMMPLLKTNNTEAFKYAIEINKKL